MGSLTRCVLQAFPVPISFVPLILLHEASKLYGARLAILLNSFRLLFAFHSLPPKIKKKKNLSVENEKHIGNICIHTTDLLHCTAETNKIL